MGEVLEVTQESLLGLQETVVEEEQVCTQRIRRGAQVTELVVPCLDE